MNFTYKSYRELLDKLKEHRYSFASYKNWGGYDRPVILRHDIDNDISKAVELAKLEKEEGVTSTFFVLLTSDFYNVYSSRNEKMLNRILEYGHDIGLHFDEVRYPDLICEEDVCQKIIEEADALAKAIKHRIDTVSMHRPSKMILDADIQIPEIINSYGKQYFEEFKYLSDSRRKWREPVEEIIASEKYDKLHILTHAFWYHDDPISIQDTVRLYINHANIERYNCMKENITDIDSILQLEDVLYE